jgi:thioredoxin reductase
MVERMQKKNALIVGAVCAALAAGGIVATAAARSGSSGTRTNHSTAGHPGGPPGGFAVHAEAVVLDKAGTAFITQTEDSGTVVSVSGDQLVIKEGTASVTYKTVSLTIASGANVYRNGAKASLSDLEAGDHVRVTSSSDGTTVMAGDKVGRPHPGGPPPGYGG